MRKIRTIIILLLVAGTFWHFYGDAFNRSGIHGVFEEARSDVHALKENVNIPAAMDNISKEFQLLIGNVKEKIDNNEQPNQPSLKKPQLDNPSEHSFSVYNIELGDDRSEVEQQVGQHKRSSLNEYGVDWVAYHENYQNFLMAAYNDEDKVVGLYTNQDLLASVQGIDFTSSREAVLTTLKKPLNGIRKGLVKYQTNNNNEYDTFLINNNYVTIFYDKHEDNTVTAIQIISGELEKQKETFYPEPSEDLKEGFEYQLFDLTNASRANHGLPILTWDKAARKTARSHSKDMAVNNYFSHTNLEGQSPFDRMEEDNLAFRMAGENLAAGQLSSIFAHEGLMNSLGHRENILQKDYEMLAIGTAFNKESKPFYTETFRTK
uniref:Secretion protein n=1 Tax=Virgibacillus oceani TaxID=1479511 RepID=A0A917HP08_9BACI|nr:secretion protein [Virgibacillus oceani]